ncbi:hypothetical protein KHA96_18615 [Bacillus sp. FJAT-49711]|uniref:nucleotidyltransferase domain-containing protein n=1 Tax=Bacillus sp. FJAT-49711 TaxID=2833585 RepID=UPI001BC97241|nr:hypothetical protein [Bacillus sp. FJAT-49711]MBS4220318.1 hypothetical protein [Bacillus sp. FJAT-49711]
MENIISSVKTFLEDANFKWAICGGCAIDLFIGKITRTHTDVDIFAFWEDRPNIITFMINKGWRVFEACGGGKVLELFDSSKTQMKRNLFCFPSSNTRCALQPTNEKNTYQFSIKANEQVAFDYIEFLFNQKDENYFYYILNDHSIKRSINSAFLIKDGLQYLSPEIVLLYKSTYINSIDASKHEQDFNSSLPHLSIEQKQWLKRSLEICHPDTHEWIPKL